MALSIRSPEISSLAGRNVPTRTMPKIRSSSSVMFSVSSRLKHLDKELLKSRSGYLDKERLKSRSGYLENYEYNVRWLLYGHVKQQMETTSNHSRKGDEEERKKQDYYVNTGYAIRTIRDSMITRVRLVKFMSKATTNIPNGDTE